MDNPVEQQNIEVPSQKKNWSNHLLSNSLYLFFSVLYITSPLFPSLLRLDSSVYYYLNFYLPTPRKLLLATIF